jgi:hypothetical protein
MRLLSSKYTQFCNACYNLSLYIVNDLYRKLQLQRTIYQYFATGGTIEVYIKPLSGYEGMPGAGSQLPATWIS